MAQTLRVDPKALLRKQALARRSALPARSRDCKSAALCAHLVGAVAGWGWPKCVAIYAALGSEVSLAQASLLLRRRGVHLLYPRRKGPAAPLVFVAADEATCWHRGHNGLMEPQGAAVMLAQIELIVVPALAFDACGTRLGYGGGYYDRTLPCIPGRRVGVAYRIQRCARLPRDAHDVAIDTIVDEYGVWRMGCGSKQGERGHG